MATTTPRAGSRSSVDMVTRWRLRCLHLEEQLEDTTAALRASEAARRELSLDYKHVLGQLWKANAGIVRRDR